MVSAGTDKKGSSEGNEIIKFGNIAVLHAYTAVGGRGADFVLVVCAVDVDVALEGVGISFLQPIEAQDA